ncbi:MAG: ribonuclease HI [Candidatus Zambryskibacteria bacterium RIFCSPLOWO2_02_FULL_51_21]|uniref:Ribonuclease H n=1 Tax=Candidatus Zambryskibacteria bacterium RIFCSPHIGHO2_02_FULL_43_37 TaxID=1802749 RepID=A0A1G2TI93_9BACT|nr:MAG: ribonuclease HI [Candidatus Zambryskibacteria bacterium RIFCSPHIGHO2_01_FULL_52_18]OHA96389.1 MAG: ribonuclease HI [Candidatus Zambryskibacteria bacterium RIFCSPHIGHO2_02_FULL_43_37]OHB11351.1 MAG: ribonuclease HI [Candidatus Zambryskibacteria bacterium RIFCSPLOWO2_02_FULL_51_21]
MITIYTDGASRGNPGPGGWAAIVMDEVKVAELGGREEHTTNNRMELMAAIKALEYADKLSDGPVEIYTDSEYVMKGITLWVEGWQKRNWRTIAKKPVLNQDLWQELLKVSEDKKIEWKYVAGHSGHKLNDRCDEVATSFADDISMPLYHGPRDSYKHL